MKILWIIGIAIMVVLVVIESYQLGVIFGSFSAMVSYKNMSGICDTVNGTMCGEYCQLNEKNETHNVQNVMRCRWGGKFIAYGKRDQWYISFNPHIFLIQCDVRRGNVLCGEADV